MLQRSVLVLNRSWTPIAVTTVKRGFSLVFQQRAKIVDTTTFDVHDFESWLTVASLPAEQAPEAAATWVRTASLLIRPPEVVALTLFNGVPRREIAFSRRNVLRRDGYQCQYCGDRPGISKLSIDHVLPSSRGGGTTWDNCVAACVRCNTRKGAQTPDEAGMELVRNPFRPSWKHSIVLGERVPESWSRFVARAVL